ncbi:MAG: hypothetical protein R3B68_13675 [Phycisphaerales bacterium]
MSPDEQRFKRVLMDAVAECRRLRYNPTRFVQMIEQQGPFDAVRALLDAPSISEGFGTLLMKNRLDLSVEAIASRPEWRPFFTHEQLAVARARLGGATD